MTITAGYDVGGAHLKVALIDDGRPIAVEQIACPLWQGIDRLDTAFRQAGPLVSRATHHAVTMTGELCELFPDRRSGVAAIVDHLAGTLGPDTCFWMGAHGFGNAEQACRDWASVASTNFLASAELVARRLGNGLLIDLGSTTTDIIPVAAGAPCPRGTTDGERLATGELVYTGLTRTDVAVVAHDAIFQGRKQRLAATFATMADVRRILSELTEDTDQHETADHRGKSVGESVARLARAFGRDAADATVEDWKSCARSIADQQTRLILDACTEVLAATPVTEDAPIIAAGIGAHIIETVGKTVDRPCRTFGAITNARDDCRRWVTRCAPAVAVALLRSQRGQDS